MDMAILQGIQSTIGSPVLDAVMPWITLLGNNGAFWILLSLVLLALPKTRHWGVLVLVAIAIDFALVSLCIKPLIGRPRPFMADPGIQLLISPPDGSSFPSGHSSVSFAAATVLMFAPCKKRWKAAVMVLACLIAFSRLYLCVHYPTDVLAGALIGIAVGIAVAAVFRRWQRRRPQAAA